LAIKSVVTVHNFVTGFKWLSYKSDIIIAISNSVKNHLIDYFGIDPKKIKVFYNCIKTSKQLLKSKEKIKYSYGIPQDHFVLFFAGRIIPEKGIKTLLESFRLLENDVQNIVLLMVGDNKSFFKPNSFPEKFNKIFLLRAEENIQKLYKIADLVILPSLKEGLGYTMLESGLYKIPFIGSRIGGIVEFIEDGVNGYLFEPGSVDDLAEKINYVLRHPEESKLGADRLHQKVINECNCEKYFTNLANIYYDLLSEK